MSRCKRNKTPGYKKLYLNNDDTYVFGVCSGIADYIGIDPMIVRGVTVICLIFGVPFVIIGYFILAWILDEKPVDMYESDEEDEFWRSVRTEPSNTVRDIRYKFRDIERRLRAAEAHVTSHEYNLKREIDGLKDK